MLISAAVATLKGFSALNKVREVLSEEARLSIIGDGAVGLAAGYLLVGNVDQLRIFSADTSPVNTKSKGLPKFVEMMERGTGSFCKLNEAQFAPAIGQPHDVIKNSNGLIISTPVTEYGALVARLRGVFSSGQAILLVNSPVGAGLQFAEELRKSKVDCQLNILELGALFDYADIDEDTLRIYGAREKISVCGNSRNETRRALVAATGLSKALIPASNLLERGLAEIERVIRPTLLLFGLLGGRTSDLNDLSHVVNPQLTTLVRSLEQEVKALCKAYRLSGRSFLETLTDLSAVDCNEVDCLDQALIAVGPTLLSQFRADSQTTDSTTLAMSVLRKDVTESLVIISEFARLARVQMPVLESIIAMAGVVSRTDLSKAGRSLSDLGLFGLDFAEVMEVVNA